jgi:hypothetical protein
MENMSTAVPQPCRTLTLEDFTTLMMGQLSGRHPTETLLAVFTVLSSGRPSQSEEGRRLITLGTLKAVCKELKVIMACHV